jgi:dopamine beta-monooxygenase
MKLNVSHASMVGLIAATTCTTITDAYPTFQSLIPNGENVMVDGELWPTVGHLALDTTMGLNPFGVHFKEYGTTWTPELCRLDSDGDGRTNGEELGDPECVWQPYVSALCLNALLLE